MFRFQLRPHRRHVQLTASRRLRVHYMRRGLKDDSSRSRVVRDPQVEARKPGDEKMREKRVR